MLNLNLDVSYGYVAWLRIFQASGLAFLFVPISTISFAGYRGKEQRRQRIDQPGA